MKINVSVEIIFIEAAVSLEFWCRLALKNLRFDLSNDESL